jgi:hypothetical protein
LHLVVHPPNDRHQLLPGHLQFRIHHIIQQVHKIVALLSGYACEPIGVRCLDMSENGILNLENVFAGSFKVA